jgi:hypothetical protein
MGDPAAIDPVLQSAGLRPRREVEKSIATIFAPTRSREVLGRRGNPLSLGVQFIAVFGSEWIFALDLRDPRHPSSLGT